MRFSLAGKRYDTDKMDDLGLTSRWQTGHRIVGVWITKKSKRVFVHRETQWQGERDHVSEADPCDIRHLAERDDDDRLRDLLPDDSE